MDLADHRRRRQPRRRERALVAGALRAAIAERVPTPPDLVEPLEEGGRDPSAFAALAVALPAEFVWSIDEARAGQASAHGRRNPNDRLAAVERLGFALMTLDHLRRTLVLAERLAPSCRSRGCRGRHVCSRTRAATSPRISTRRIARPAGC